jgi:hypothetical protein
MHGQQCAHPGEFGCELLWMHAPQPQLLEHAAVPSAICSLSAQLPADMSAALRTLTIGVFAAIILPGIPCVGAKP